MDIYNFPGVIYATDGSKGSTRMGAGFYRHDTKGSGCCRVWGGVSGGSSGRTEFAAASLGLANSLAHDQPIAVLTDSKGLHPTFSWTEEGVEHRCSMNKTLQTREHLKVSELQLPLHKNYTSEFLNREINCRDLLGKHWQDKTATPSPQELYFRLS